ENVKPSGVHVADSSAWNPSRSQNTPSRRAVYVHANQRHDTMVRAEVTPANTHIVPRLDDHSNPYAKRRQAWLKRREQGQFSSNAHTAQSERRWHDWSGTANAQCSGFRAPYR